jgi:hypothetical protein
MQISIKDKKLAQLRFHSKRQLTTRASKRNFARRNKAALGPWGQTEISLKIVDLLSKKTLVNFHKSLK